MLLEYEENGNVRDIAGVSCKDQSGWTRKWSSTERMSSNENRRLAIFRLSENKVRGW